MKNLILFLLLFTINIFATTYYVSSTGNNSNNGLTILTAWQTIGKINSSTTTNDIIYLRGLDRFSDASLTPKNGQRYYSYGTGRSVINGNHTHDCIDMITGNNGDKNNIIFNGIKFTGGLTGNITTWGCSYITFESCTIDSAYQTSWNGAPPGMLYFGGGGDISHHITIRNSNISYSKYGHGIYFDGVRDVLLEYDTIQYNGANGFQTYSAGTNVADSFMIRYNVIRQNNTYNAGGSFAIYDNSMKHSNVYYNVIENNSNDAGGCNIFIQNDYSTPPRNVKYYNNTFITHGSASYTFGIGLNNASGIDSQYIKNNIFYLDQSDAYAFYFYGTVGTNCQIDYNCYCTASGSNINLFHYGSNYTSVSSWYSVHGYDQHSFIGNPLFTDYANKNYYLLVGSPCIDYGINVSLVHDILNRNIQNLPDLGSYENYSNIIPPPPPDTTTPKLYTFPFRGVYDIHTNTLIWVGNMITDSTQCISGQFYILPDGTLKRKF